MLGTQQRPSNRTKQQHERAVYKDVLSVYYMSQVSTITKPEEVPVYY